MNEIVEALWFFLPAGFGNVTPIFASRTPVIKNWKTPMDFGKSLKGERLFGDNKTWRGLFSGAIVALLVIAVQKYLYSNTAWAPDISWFDYSPGIIWLLGPLMGVGALLGDAVKSHFKRRKGIKPGDSWIPFDQTDYIIGGTLFALPIASITLAQFLWVLGVWLGMHLLSVYVGFQLGIRDKPI